MATTKSSAKTKSAHAGKSESSTKKSASKKSSGSKAKKPTAATKRKSSSAAHSRASAAAKGSDGKAHKTGKKTEHGQAWTEKHSDNPSSTGHGKAKKEPAKQEDHCWPGYKAVPGKKAGTKGSCEKKDHQTAAEKKSDAMAAAGSKLRKAGGNKSRANHAK